LRPVKLPARSLVPVLFLVFAVSLLVGPGLGIGSMVRGLLDSRDPMAGTAWTLLNDLRLPRSVLAVLVGASLSVGGVLLQTYFQNPMAGPYVVGVSSGAGLAVAILAVVTGAGFPSTRGVAVAALLGSLGIVLVVERLAAAIRGRRTETLLLIGIAIASVCSALTSVLLLMLPRGPEGVLFWLMGSLTGASWGQAGLVLVGLAASLAIAIWHTPALDAILWGDEIAQSVGVGVRRLRLWMLGAASLAVAATVATCGVIAFLGLMAPHVARGIVGGRHARLIPAAAVVGAGWLLAADVGARLLLAPAELPVGAITSAIGAPFLVWICLRRR
jgi:iron complex transport system permease protein